MKLPLPKIPFVQRASGEDTAPSIRDALEHTITTLILVVGSVGVTWVVFFAHDIPVAVVVLLLLLDIWMVLMLLTLIVTKGKHLVIACLDFWYDIRQHKEERELELAISIDKRVQAFRLKLTTRPKELEQNREILELMSIMYRVELDAIRSKRRESVTIRPEEKSVPTRPDEKSVPIKLEGSHE
jgi:hypothetical protein